MIIKCIKNRLGFSKECYYKIVSKTEFRYAVLNNDFKIEVFDKETFDKFFRKGQYAHKTIGYNPIAELARKYEHKVIS